MAAVTGGASPVLATSDVGVAVESPGVRSARACDSPTAVKAALPSAVMSTGDDAAGGSANVHEEHDTNESQMHETVHLLDSSSLLDDEYVFDGWRVFLTVGKGGEVAPTCPCLSAYDATKLWPLCALVLCQCGRQLH